MYPSKKILLSLLTAIYVDQGHASSCGRYMLLGFQQSNCTALHTPLSEPWYPLLSAIKNTNGSRESLGWQGLEAQQVAEVRSVTFVYGIPDWELINPTEEPTGCKTMHLEFYNNLNQSMGYDLMNTSQTKDTCHYFKGAIAVSHNSVEILGSCTELPVVG